MLWNKFTIETTTEAADIVASVLFDNNIVGAEIEDNMNLSDEDLKKMYVDIPVKKIDDGKAKVSFFVAVLPKEEKDEYIHKYRNENQNKDFDISNYKQIIDDSYWPSTDNVFTKEEFDEIFASIKNGLEEYKDFMDMGSLDISVEELDDNIFLNKWKENFKRLEIDDIVICPSWEKCETNSKAVFIEPGNAFGTGQHATTKLCVKAIKTVIENIKNSCDENKNICNDSNNLSLLDIGCGSGILGIVGKKLGVKNICLIDVDKDVEFNLVENCKLNGLTPTKLDKNNSDILHGFGNLIDDAALRQKVGYVKYDIVVANILAPVICSLLGAGEVDKFLKPGGYFICSGILREKENEVKEAIIKNGNLTIVDIQSESDWVCIISKEKK